MPRKVVRRHRVPKRAPTTVLEAPEGNPYEYAGLAPDGLPLRVPVFEFGTRHQIGWLGYDDRKATRI